MSLLIFITFLSLLCLVVGFLADREKDNEGDKGRDYGGHVRVVRGAVQR